MTEPTNPSQPASVTTERIAALDALNELHQLSPDSEIRIVPYPEMNGRMMWLARLENYHRHIDGGGATIEAAIRDLLDKAKGGANDAA